MKTIVCLLLFSFCLSWVKQPLLSVYLLEEINTEEGEFIITKYKTRILSFHNGWVGYTKGELWGLLTLLSSSSGRDQLGSPVMILTFSSNSSGVIISWNNNHRRVGNVLGRYSNQLQRIHTLQRVRDRDPKPCRDHLNNRCSHKDQRDIWRDSESWFWLSGSYTKGELWR